MTPPYDGRRLPAAVSNPATRMCRGPECKPTREQVGRHRVRPEYRSALARSSLTPDRGGLTQVPRSSDVRLHNTGDGRRRRRHRHRHREVTNPSLIGPEHVEWPARVRQIPVRPIRGARGEVRHRRFARTEQRDGDSRWTWAAAGREPKRRAPRLPRAEPPT